MLTALPTRDPSRWVRGHHLFFSLCQGLILSTSVARRDIDARRCDAAAQAIENAITILSGVAAAFRYSADIDQTVYGNVLEPSMSERKGFSGLWSTDHAEFLRQHGLLQKAMTEMPPKYTSLIRRYEHAISAVWMSHSDVCRHIAGQRASINAQQASNPEAHLPGHLDLKHYYRPKALHGPKEAGKYEEAAKAGNPRCPLGHADSEAETCPISIIKQDIQ